MPELRRMLALGAVLLIVLLIGLGGLGGCASDVASGVTYDPLTQFPRKAFIAWDERANRLPDDPRLADLDLDAAVKRAVNAEFAAKGYEQTTGDAHYYVSYQIAVNTWTGPGESLAVGTLSLELDDARSRRRVWNGFARADVQVGLTHEERVKRLRGVVKKLLKDFPPTGRN